ncbi:S-adenosylmethionine-dependent methyltransferase Rv2258c-like [Ptychodera flava]|uniref:S-adenosylmethionine-dependent methyltransferase Rv2258c-like n=1 Tax=Ptychodera flava TaxID=63121 RepID=UPI003969CC9C
MSESQESFEQRVFGTVREGYTAVSIAIGSATGLFNTMAKLGEAKTSTAIADAAGLKERYVREWLGAMVTGGIVEVDSEKDTYYLPPHRHNALCTQGGTGTLSVLCEGIPTAIEAYKEIVDCFKKEGPAGVPYSKYTLHPSWGDKLAKCSLQDKAPKFLTESEIIKKLLETSSTVCELGCGSGAALCLMARDFPHCEFHGIDNAEKSIEAAKSKAESMQLSNVTFHLVDVTESGNTEDWKAKFDLVYCMDVVHDVGRPDLMFAGINHLMKDNGYFVMKDIAGHTKHADNIKNSMAPCLYTVSLFRCMPSSLACGDDSFGLGAMWGREKALAMLEEAGFECFHAGQIDLFTEDFYCRKK